MLQSQLQRGVAAVHIDAELMEVDEEGE